MKLWKIVRRLARAREPEERPQRGYVSDKVVRISDFDDDPVARRPVLVPELSDAAAPRPEDGHQLAVHLGAQDDDATSDWCRALHAEAGQPLDPTDQQLGAMLAEFNAVLDGLERGLAACATAVCAQLDPRWRTARCGRADCPCCPETFEEILIRALGDTAEMALVTA